MKKDFESKCAELNQQMEDMKATTEEIIQRSKRDHERNVQSLQQQIEDVLYDRPMYFNSVHFLSSSLSPMDYKYDY
jgi:ElaB/YqjD/DUF883 family membrane-anchored ribosome-binding protein